MGDDDRTAVGVRVQNCICPIEHRLAHAGVILEVDNDEIHPPCAEEIEMIVIVRAVVAGVIRAPIEVIRSEILIIIDSRAGGIADRLFIMIANSDTIGNALGQQGARWIFDAVQRIGGVPPFRRVL